MSNPTNQQDAHTSSGSGPIAATASKAERAQAAQQRREQIKERARRLGLERKTPLPSNVAMVKYKGRVAILEKRADQYVLKMSADAAQTYPLPAVKPGRLVAGRIFLAASDGKTAKVRAYPAGARALSELGTPSSTGGSGWESFSGLGDDPISMVIALVAVVVAVVLLPLVIWLWVKERSRRKAEATRVLTAPAPEADAPAATRSG
jgi:hypothetical protein